MCGVHIIRRICLNLGKWLSVFGSCLLMHKGCLTKEQIMQIARSPFVSVLLCDIRFYTIVCCNKLFYTT